MRMRILPLSLAVVLVGCRPFASEPQTAVHETAVDAAATGEVRTRELELRLLGQTLGTMTVELAPLPDGGERWTVKTQMTIALVDRGESPKTMSSEEVYDYDARRAFVRSTEIDREQGVEERTEMVREGDELRVLIEGPSHRDERRFPIPPTFTNQNAVFHALVAEVNAGEALPRSRTYSTFDEERMAFRDSTLLVQGRTKLQVGEETIDGWAVVSTDADGERTKAVLDGAGMVVQLEIGPFSAALVGAAASTKTASLSSYLKVEGRISENANPLDIELVVDGDEPDLPPALVDSPYQRVKRNARGYALALQRMACDASCDGIALPMKLPPEVAPFLKPSPASQSDAKEIVAQAKAIAGEHKDARKAAEAIIRWVHANLDKRDGTRGASTAVETLAEGGGDCTEHTALAVALLRAAGLPARNTNGIVLVPGWFGAEAGYHAWPEVWLGRWVVMDAALGRTEPGAHYIFFGHDEPGMDDGGSSLTRLLGRTVIRAR